VKQSEIDRATKLNFTIVFPCGDLNIYGWLDEI
jgi:hypothetical protein